MLTRHRQFRHHTSFETSLGAIALGNCHKSQPCGDDAYETSPSTALLDSQCLEFSTCSGDQYESRPPSPNLDRECLQITDCQSIGLSTLTPATATSDAVCFNFTIECVLRINLIPPGLTGQQVSIPEPILLQ